MDNYNCLDLNIIKEKVCNYAYIEEAKTFIIEEAISFNPLVIKNNLKETSEALNLLKKDFNVSFDGIKNINNILDKADKNIRLEGKEVRDVLVFHNNCYRIKKLFNSLESELSLKDYTDSLNINADVFDKIEKIIDNNGDIKDDATDKLKNINSELDICDKQLYNRAYEFIAKHSDSLQEQSIFERNNRLTFLVKNSDKNKFSGYTYGTSSSGLASYVEPGILVELNNKKNDLLQARQDEIEAILIQLTYLISSISEAYYHNFDSILKLCVIFAKAKYGFDNLGIIPEITNNTFFEFNNLCHPLIDANKVVSNSYRLFEPYYGIVICGSNTGGKTVSLKAIGLSILMTYLGIPIIASDAKVPLYKKIFVDIDDNQSIADSLSTFSAHITNINNILNNADENSLILIDELISGTDPKEAQAISLAILDKIKQLQSKFIITTHFDDIKNYSYNDENILLSSVGFDMNTLKPTYKYLEDSIGSSNAIEIASRYFDDANIINNAKNYLSKTQTKQDLMIQKLSKQIEENLLEKEKIDKVKQEALNIKNDLQTKLNEFESNKLELKNNYLKELNDYIDSIKQKALEKLDSIKEKETVVVKEIESLKETEIVDEVVEFNVGDNVRIKDNEQIGTIIDISDDKVTVNVRGLTIKTNKSDLFLMPKIKKNETKVITKKYSRIPSEINLVGCRVEDGLDQVLNYLDRANAANMSQVKIIHGIGTGALRSAIRDKLKKLSYVKSFNDGDFYDGGSAVTIVIFK